MNSIYKSQFQPIMERWSLLLKLILLMAGLSFLLKSFMLHSLLEQMASVLLGVLLLSLFIYFLIAIPTCVCLEKEQLVIKRVFGRKCIPYDVITEVFVYDGVQNDVRHFGSNGFLGYMGVMESNRYGKYYSYVKNPKQQIFIVTEKNNYLISCDNRDEFIKELQSHL